MEELVKNIKFNEQGLIPVVVQDHVSREVLMLAYMNGEALEKTLSTGKVHYWSRSRQKLWLKGETSGHFQFVREIRLDCDRDSILILAEQVDAACHTGKFSCFYTGYRDGKLTELESVKPEACCPENRDKEPFILQQVYDVIVDRTLHPKEGSYTNYLFSKGIDKMLKKVGEESAEVIIAAKNNVKGEVVYEVSDLLYHLMVVLVEQGIKLEDIYKELEGRR